MCYNYTTLRSITEVKSVLFYECVIMCEGIEYTQYIFSKDREEKAFNT